MEISNLQAWLNDPSDYDTGLKLYRHFIGHNGMLQVLEIGCTRYNQEKLHEALQEHANQLTPETPHTTTPLFAKDESHVPAEVVVIDREWRGKYKELNSLFQDLRHTDDPETRRVYCLRIVREMKEDVKPAWKKLDFYKESGRLPQEAQEKDPLQELVPLSEPQKYAVAQLQNLPPRISKARKKDPEKADRLLEELNALKAKLGLDG